LQASEGVDGRIKSGHDDAKWYSRRLRLVVGAQKPEPDNCGLDPVIHVFLQSVGWTWIAGSSPAMTAGKCVSIKQIMLPRLQTMTNDYGINDQ